jgi:CDGSH-type Zn-finger protein
MSLNSSTSIRLHLQKGKKYSICTCGASKVLPYCDNQHRILNKEQGTNYKSLKIVVEDDVNVTLDSSTWKG